MTELLPLRKGSLTLSERCPPPDADDGGQGGLTYYMYILTGFAALGGFMFGYDTGVISGAMLFVRDDMHLSTVQQEVVVSMAIVGAVLGSAVGAISDKTGRRPMIIAGSVLLLAGPFILSCATSYDTLVFGRLVVGLGIGLSSVTVPIYIAEAAPSQYRGQLTTVNNVALGCGMATTYVVNGFLSYLTNGWRYMLGAAAVPALMQLLGFMFLPESPRWLAQHGNHAQARAVLQQLRQQDAHDEWESIIADVAAQAAQDARAASTGVKGLYGQLEKVLSDPVIRRELLVGCSMQALNQLTAINTVMYYSATILKSAGMGGEGDNSSAIWGATLLPIFNLAFATVAMVLVERKGRRWLTMLSLSGLTVALLALALSFQFGPQLSGTLFDGRVTIGSLLTLASLLAYLAAFAVGMGAVPWVLNAEIYPVHARGMCGALATTTNWLCNVLVSMTFLTLCDAITPAGTFSLYAAMGAAGLAFVYQVVPETKGYTLEEIQDLFTHPAMAHVTDS